MCLVWAGCFYSGLFLTDTNQIYSLSIFKSLYETTWLSSLHCSLRFSPWFHSGLCCQWRVNWTQRPRCPVSSFFGDDDSDQMKSLRNSQQQRKHNSSVPTTFSCSHHVFMMFSSCSQHVFMTFSPCSQRVSDTSQYLQLLRISENKNPEHMFCVSHLARRCVCGWTFSMTRQNHSWCHVVCPLLQISAFL